VYEGPLVSRRSGGAGVFNEFKADSKVFGELLGDIERSRFVVPRFQRGYSWEKKHVTAFWNDITRFEKENKEKDGPEKYFLGPIVIMPDKDKQKGIIYVLDGQQRLATATILLSVIRDIAKGIPIAAATSFADDIHNHSIWKDDAKNYALELGELDKGYFAETIQAYPPNTRDDKIRSHSNIKSARALLRDFVNTEVALLDQAAKLDRLKALRAIVKSDLVMACIPVSELRDAFRIFETLNDRGLRLSVPDLLLNYLMGEAKSDADRGLIRDFWNDMIEDMGRRNINRFLRHMWVSKYGDLKNVDLFSALKQHIEGNKINSVDFARTCSEECVRYVQLLKAETKQLGDAAPYVSRIAGDLGFESALPVLLSASAYFSNSELAQLAKLLLVFVTRHSIIARIDPSNLETVLFGLARDLRAKMTVDKPNVNTCLTYIKTVLVKNAPNENQIEAAIPELLLDVEEAQYVVSRIATRMQTQTKEIAIDEANLEHIFPKKPSADWKNKDQLEPFLWHLGNLTMLGERLNAGVANSGYDQKKAHYSKASELVMAKDIAKKHKTWDSTAIKARALSLGPYIKEIWNFDNPSRV
jgi:hypothetical protein